MAQRRHGEIPRSFYTNCAPLYFVQMRRTAFDIVEGCLIRNIVMKLFKCIHWCILILFSALEIVDLIVLISIYCVGVIFNRLMISRKTMKCLLCERVFCVRIKIIVWRWFEISRTKVSKSTFIQCINMRNSSSEVCVESSMTLYTDHCTRFQESMIWMWLQNLLVSATRLRISLTTKPSTRVYFFPDSHARRTEERDRQMVQRGQRLGVPNPRWWYRRCLRTSGMSYFILYN